MSDTAEVEQFDMGRFDALNGVMSNSLNGLPNVADPGDAKLWVKFEMASHFNDAKSREAARPIFEMREYINIAVPGDQTTMIRRPIRESDKFRFARQWEAFKSGRSQVTGIPLAEWNGISRAQCDELAFFKIHTVEQLAGMADGLLSRFPGLVTIRDSAKLYLEERKTSAPLDKLRGEVLARDERIRLMESQQAQMQAKLDELLAAQSKGGGKKAA